MRAWHFSENAYPYLPPAESYPSIRVSLPNRIYDPEKGAALYDRFIEEWLIAEDEGVRSCSMSIIKPRPVLIPRRL
jgi:hypothetical protein